MPVANDDSGKKPAGGRRSVARRVAAGAFGGLLAASVLSACSSSGGGRATINFYSFQDNSGAVQQAVDECATSQYKVVYNKLPASADQQRQQLVRRLAAQDSSIDLMGLDVTWEAEFAEAGWIQPWTGANKAAATNGTLAVPLQTATWKNKLYAVPYNSNTQLLWYRQDLLDQIGKSSPPATWAEMLEDTDLMAKKRLPHYIEVQGAQYEGATVWFNTMVASAGGSILDSAATKASLGAPAVKALTIMKQLAGSSAADPSLSVQMEDANRLAMESGAAAFELNYPFVYPSMQADNPKVKTYNGKSLAENFKYTTYPRVNADEASHVTIGGIDIGVSSYSPHSSLAFQAALCLRNKAHQEIAATKGGLPPTLASLYANPSASFKKAYPFYRTIFDALKTASIRPKTPAYQNVSIVVSHAVSPPNKINPQSTESDISGQIADALASKGLIP